jgi:type 1 glutamine amidotransferase
MKQHLIAAASLALASLPASAVPWVTYEGGDGPGKGKHVVLIAGDEEYRSEEALPMLGQILATHHGFKCTVLFSVDEQGIIDPTAQASITNPAALDSADVIIMALRFRNWPDADMKHFVDAFHRGVPVVALRTSTHAFNYGRKQDSAYAKYSFNAKDWKGGFGKQVLGETWVNHHGRHKVEGTRGVIEEANKDNPVLKSVSDVFGDTDVYGVSLPEDATILLRGAVTETLDPASKPVEGKKNDPMMPVAWTRHFKNETGRTNRIFTTTMGSASDFRSEDLRRLVVNATYWALELEIPARAKVDFVTPFDPTFYGFGNYKKGVRPADLRLPAR